MTLTSESGDPTVTHHRSEVRRPPTSTPAVGDDRRRDPRRRPRAAALGRDRRRAPRRLLLQYKVIFFPGQHLDPAQHIALARNFGEPTPAHPVIPGIDGFPEVFEIDYTKSAQLRESYGDVVDRYDGLSWHTDVTFVERPPLGSILNAVVIPPAGGDTMFSDQRAAYEALSEPLRDFLDGLVAVHDGSQAFGALLKAREDGGGEWEGKQYKSLDPVEHPVVRTHPETGRKSLFVNAGFTSHIKGLTPRRERRAAAVPLRALDQAAVHGALPLARGRPRLLGQPRDAAQRRRRLHRPAPRHPARDPARRPPA